MIYQAIFKLVFAKLDPEFAHHLVVFGLKVATVLGFRAPRKPRNIQVMGLGFENRLGLAAGFDKDAKLIEAMHALGFGHVEIGTVTAKPQRGNEKPRMFRLLPQRALINRMGFNNEGADAIAVRLLKLRQSSKNLPVIGVNIGKSKLTDAADAAADYAYSAKLLAPLADYLVVNVSSPNTPGLRDLQQVSALAPILQAVKEKAGKVPVLVKLAPDLANEDLVAALELVKNLSLAGVIAANTTVRRDFSGDPKILAESGGLSGPMLHERAVEMLKIIRKHLDKSFTVVSVGGIETPEQARERIALGADLIQAYTGLVYFGPLWPARIAKSV